MLLLQNHRVRRQARRQSRPVLAPAAPAMVPLAAYMPSPALNQIALDFEFPLRNVEALVGTLKAFNPNTHSDVGLSAAEIGATPNQALLTVNQMPAEGWYILQVADALPFTDSRGGELRGLFVQVQAAPEP